MPLMQELQGMSVQDECHLVQGRPGVPRNPGWAQVQRRKEQVDCFLPLLHPSFRVAKQVKVFMERMEKRLVKQGRVEEFNNQFKDTVDGGSSGSCRQRS